MLRCTSRLTDQRTALTTAKPDGLPHVGEHVTLHYQPYVVDAAPQEGITVRTSVSECRGKDTLRAGKS